MPRLAPKAPNAIAERLANILDWYKGMVAETTGRLLYLYDPVKDFAVADGSPIRDIASIWDVELLSRFLDRDDLLPVVERSLAHYSRWLIARGDALILDSTSIGETSGIAHSAFMILALLESDFPGRRAKIIRLAQGLLDQQDENGSYRTSFGGEGEDGNDLYAGEAMLALLEAHELVQDPRYLSSVERGFGWYSRQLRADEIAADYLPFYANWQSQYGALLYANSESPTLRRAVRDYVFALNDHIVDLSFYDDIERQPLGPATVQVACALEGLNDGYAIAVREGDAERIRRYAHCIRIALAWLFRAQRFERCTARERGGFGHSLTDRTQRIDVTGHVLGGFIKSAQNHIGT